MKRILIRDANIVNEGKIIRGDVYIKEGLIYSVGGDLSGKDADIVIDAKGKYLLPGLIDDQVHFREPGLTHKAEIYTESKTAVAGGVTSFMEMPNTIPQSTTHELLEEKYAIGAAKSLANYSFYLGATNDNIETIKSVDVKNVCGVKVFQGSSTGNMLVDNPDSLEAIFRECPILIATHSENDNIIKANLERFKQEYGEDIPAKFHPKIRSEEACYDASKIVVEMARTHGTKLHVLHISTGKEVGLFDNTLPLAEKRITAEACIHHLWFSEEDYNKKGNWIKWNPAIKTSNDRDTILKGVLEGNIDVIATDHAPHTIGEKEQPYLKAPSGGPLLQHGLVALLEMYHNGKISLEQIVQKTSHNVAILFEIESRGFLREGYYADLVLVDLDNSWEVERENVLSKCGWSPFEGQKFRSKVTHTIVSGHLAYENGVFNEEKKGERLKFSRNI
ncbi:dihydroorotase [Cyclobacterium marinum]|uniref:Amidohydrolase n=1 Tax=Cyclobacterium marinum (strain ATCC 25205 / DSM 745 / LMG 13164 / NCIMB 1802) TaxID=880070 RepID=G0IVN8_CYCMS|nr:dihydroorotase [Cyclobacterium marinum]AEL24805.1 amidohydrolase [Cyclobacterium marinum DSM 745]MBI0401722.1 dihydroorotase [Cyclobacterium marinum]MBR9774718.1 dihydroorotase [Cytophagales bacterium]|tara:strand:+ start:27193 stop:28536 length:1344 start_codon:yes stop_codon:yes gene_type:complete